MSTVITIYLVGIVMGAVVASMILEARAERRENNRMEDDVR